EYDFRSNHWKCHQTSQPQKFGSSCLSKNGKMYIIFGTNSKIHYNDIIVFEFPEKVNELDDKKWKIVPTKGDVPEERCSSSCVYIPNLDTFYLFGGRGFTTFNDIYKFEFK